VSALLLTPAAVVRGDQAVATLEDCDRQVLNLGYRILAVQDAIANPETPGAMQAILELGHDSRYYVMVRGWLELQLRADSSILAASRGDAPPNIVRRVALLQKAIRALDLE
jgi:hypothetical protein